MDEWMNEWMNDWLNDLKYMHESLNEWMNEWRKEGRKEGRNDLIEMKEWRWLTWNERIEMNELKFMTVSRAFCRPHLPKVTRDLQFFTIFMFPTTWWWCGRHMRSSSRGSLVHILPTSSSKSTFLTFSNGKKISRYIQSQAISCTFCRPHLPKAPRSSQQSCTFCRPHLPKAARTPQLFSISIGNGALATVLCTFCRQLSPIQLRTRGDRDPRSATAEATTLPGNQRVHARVPDPLHFTTTWWWCGCHDDVVDMVIEMTMCLPWWWESYPWQSHVTLKFLNKLPLILRYLI